MDVRMEWKDYRFGCSNEAGGKSGLISIVVSFVIGASAVSPPNAIRHARGSVTPRARQRDAMPPNPEPRAPSPVPLTRCPMPHARSPLLLPAACACRLRLPPCSCPLTRLGPSAVPFAYARLPALAPFRLATLPQSNRYLVLTARCSGRERASSRFRTGKTPTPPWLQGDKLELVVDLPLHPCPLAPLTLCPLEAVEKFRRRRAERLTRHQTWGFDATPSDRRAVELDFDKYFDSLPCRLTPSRLVALPPSPLPESFDARFDTEPDFAILHGSAPQPARSIPPPGPTGHNSRIAQW